jgi:prophage regulatory protein
MSIVFIRKPEVMRRTGLKSATIYQWIAAGIFPRQYKLGKRASGWREDEIIAWQESRRNTVSKL